VGFQLVGRPHVGRSRLRFARRTRLDRGAAELIDVQPIDLLDVLSIDEDVVVPRTLEIPGLCIATLVAQRQGSFSALNPPSADKLGAGASVYS